jgi:hypothetical protein
MAGNPKIFLKLELWTSVSTLANSSFAAKKPFNSIATLSSIQFPIMAEGGIDRKADERMEFTTSKDVTVAPTFQVGDEIPGRYGGKTTDLNVT